MKVKAIIERGTDGTYGIYMDDDILNYSVNGDGNSVDEAKKDFFAAYEAMKKHYEKNGDEFLEADFYFEYDIASFLENYSKVFSKPGLEEITGVNQKQFFHYLAGQKPSKKTILKIQEGLHKLGKELSQVNFID